MGITEDRKGSKGQRGEDSLRSLWPSVETSLCRVRISFEHYLANAGNAQYCPIERLHASGFDTQGGDQWELQKVAKEAKARVVKFLCDLCGLL